MGIHSGACALILHRGSARAGLRDRLRLQAAKLQSEMQYQKRSRLPEAIRKLEEEVLTDRSRLEQLKKVLALWRWCIGV